MTIPQPPTHSFASDNVAGAHPRVIEALSAANTGTAAPYGDDPWTQRATRKFRDLLEAEVEVLFTYGGTGANVVALQSILAPHEAVVCPSSAHINVEECGAFERFTGTKLIDVPSDDGKLHPDAITDLLRPAHGEHNVTPKVLAISQVTELGSVYTIDEITQLAELAHAHGLLLFMDGARIANAAAALGCSPRQLTVDAGVDVLTFGGTKNGLVYCESVIYLRPQLAARARFARKQAGQLASKMRFIAAQFDALLTDQLWLNNAHHANHAAALLADRIADTPHVDTLQAPQANSIFAHIPEHAIEPLQNWSFFWTWDAATNLVRWMTSFATTQSGRRPLRRRRSALHPTDRPRRSRGRCIDNIALPLFSPRPGRRRPTEQPEIRDHSSWSTRDTRANRNRVLGFAKAPGLRATGTQPPPGGLYAPPFPTAQASIELACGYGRSALGDCCADGGHDFVCPKVQCRVADAVARTDHVLESGGSMLEHGRSELLYPLRHSTPDPAAVVVSRLREWIPGNPAYHDVRGPDISRVSPYRSSGFVDDGPRFGNQLGSPVSGVWWYPPVGVSAGYRQSLRATHSDPDRWRRCGRGCQLGDVVELAVKRDRIAAAGERSDDLDRLFQRSYSGSGRQGRQTKRNGLLLHPARAESENDTTARDVR